MGKKRMSTLSVVLIAVSAAIIATVIALNFVSGEKKIKQVIDKRYSIGDPQFLRSMGALLGPAIVPGNHVQTLVNGAEIFPAMLAEIRAAKKSITFETYIYWSGTIGKEFSDALSERARAGVRVFVLLDWTGAAKMEDDYLQNMKDAGVQIEKYHPLRWYNISRMNNRTHRKLLIVDGKVGFTGGVGIADQWNGTAQDKDHWRDTHFRIEGPVVAQMQAAFMDNWIKTRGQVLHGEDFFPALTPVGEDAGQMFKSSPSEGAESMRLMYLLSISAAQKSITLSSAYFVPDDLTIEMLTEAMHRGVRFQVIVPSGKIDTEIVRKASRARWGKLLEAGAEISEYQPTMFHCKVMVVDDLWVSVGSTNFDNRSFRLNDEANLNIYDREFAQRQTAVFNEDLKKSRRITLEQWQNRPWQEKLLEHTSALLRSQL
jgi:cardiolipin synthase